LQLEPVHARHLNVDEQTGSVVQLDGVQETFGRFKGSRSKAERLDEECRSPTDGLIVVNDRD